MTKQKNYQEDLMDAIPFIRSQLIQVIFVNMQGTCMQINLETVIFSSCFPLLQFSKVEYTAATCKLPIRNILYKNQILVDGINGL